MIYDIFYVSKQQVDTAGWQQFCQRFPSAQKIDNVKTIDDVKKKSFTKFFWLVWDDVVIADDFMFDYRVEKWDEDYVHVFKNSCNGVESFISGIALIPKKANILKKEFDFKFYVNKKEIDILASKYQYPIRNFTSYEEYVTALNETSKSMVWCVWPDIEIVDDSIFDLYFDPLDGKYDYDRTINHVFKNKVNNEESYISGVSLCCPTNLISKKEFNHRFFIDKKEYDQLGSNTRLYEKFVIDTFNDYTKALASSKTEMFWLLPPEVEPLDDFKFDLQFSHHNNYERSINHVFKNKDIEEDKYNGIMLLSKQAPISAREVEYRYIVKKKEHDILASKLKLYDIVFISYNESNADENFAKLIEKFPRAKRIHGVKGIHQAHIAAAKISTTPMFWVVDGDAIVEDNFAFDLLLPKHDTDIVHVWLSKNPINNLIYGYGGVKLLPRHLTLCMDETSVDMTMSISNKFKVVKEVSNVTAFNTDPFNTWKSAFRECVKLASRPIGFGYEEETEDRLITWCNLGADQLYGEHCILGARAGRQYGLDNITNLEALAKINDFNWLHNKFTNKTSL